MKRMKAIELVRVFLLIFLICMFCRTGYSQEDTTIVEPLQDSSVLTPPDEDEGNLPVRFPWTTGMLIDNQTVECPNAGAIEIAIQHRFGKIKNLEDLLGIYAASNIRLGVTYGITKDIAIGFGTEKNNKLQEFTGKYKIISQTRNGKIPVSVTYFGNIVIDARDKEFFGNDFEFINRLSFFNQILVSRKINNALSVELSGSFSHFNAVSDLVTDSAGRIIGKWKNDYIGIMAGGRYKFYNNMSVMLEYSQPFAINKAWESQSEPKPSLGIGLEIGTSTHAFQIFAANYESIVPQKNYSNNVNDISKGDWHFGFNITVRL